MVRDFFVRNPSLFVLVPPFAYRVRDNRHINARHHRVADVVRLCVRSRGAHFPANRKDVGDKRFRRCAENLRFAFPRKCAERVCIVRVTSSTRELDVDPRASSVGFIIHHENPRWVIRVKDDNPNKDVWVQRPKLLLELADNRQA